MSAHVSQAFNIAHCTDSEDLPITASATSARWAIGGKNEWILGSPLASAATRPLRRKLVRARVTITYMWRHQDKRKKLTMVTKFGHIGANNTCWALSGPVC